MGRGEQTAYRGHGRERAPHTEFMKRWLEDVARPTIRYSTYRQYEALIRVHINPRLGGIRLSTLTAAHVEGLYAAMERDGASGRMRQLVHARLFTALKKAVRWNLILHNVCLDVDRPAAQTKRFKVFNRNQVAQLLQAAEGKRLFALYVIAVTTGLREGEILGLQWDDVDLIGGTLYVRHQLQEVAGRLELTEPKTAAGRRQVVLPQIAVEALRLHRARTLDEGWDVPWVFCDTKGGPIRKSNLRRKSWEPLLKEARLPHIRFHDLRHTAATLLLCEDVHPKVVQERLGHARIGITLDTYSHVLPSMQRQAAEKLDRMFAKLDRGDWLQLGYKTAGQGRDEEAGDSANSSNLKENEEWSHVDSNHGPPACEAGALTS